MVVTMEAKNIESTNMVVECGMEGRDIICSMLSIVGKGSRYDNRRGRQRRKRCLK